MLPASLVLLLAAASGAAGCVRHDPRGPREPEEAALAPGTAAGTSDADPLHGSFLGRLPPRLPRRGTWVNLRAGSASLEDLRGRVVVLDFAFLGCGACDLLTPWLVEWHRRHAEQGLVVVYVDNGAQDTLDALQGWHLDHQVPFALFHDRLGRAVADYRVRAFPTVYVIGRDGRVVWEGVATGAEAYVDAAISQALAAPAPAPEAPAR